MFRYYSTARAAILALAMICINSAVKSEEVFLSYDLEAYFLAEYVHQPNHKALAIGPHSAWSVVWGIPSSAQAQRQAVEQCNAHLKGRYASKRKCEVYASDDKVLGPKPERLLTEIATGPDQPLQQPRYRFNPPLKPRGILLNLHGCNKNPLTESRQWEEPWIRQFIELGLMVVSPDSFAEKRPAELCGVPKGSTQAKIRSEIIRFRVAQTRRTIKRLMTEQPDLPIYVWGHSEGGVIAQLFPEKVAGIIVTGQSCGVLSVPAPSALSDRSVPILFILGGADKVITETGVNKEADVREQCPQKVISRNWSYVYLPKEGHFPKATDDNVNAALFKFFRQLKEANNGSLTETADEDLVKQMMVRRATQVSNDLQMAPKEAVQSWQRYLAEKGYYGSSIDGLFGKGTNSAVEKCAEDPKCWLQ